MSDPSNPSGPSEVTLSNLPRILSSDSSVKVAGIDIDGQLRGKLMSKKKFLSIAKSGFGFCSVVFGWDMHDRMYFKELKVSNAANGYRDVIAVPDLSSFRRIPWEKDVPFFLVDFLDPDTGKAVSACSRGLLKKAVGEWEAKGLGALAGGETSFVWMAIVVESQSLYSPGVQRNMSSINTKHPSLHMCQLQNQIQPRQRGFWQIIHLPL